MRFQGAIGDDMGKVIIAFKIFPETPENLSEVKAAIKELDPERLDEEPIAFGLKALKVIFIIPDAGGEQDKLENKLREIPNVGAVETERVSKSL